MKNLREIVNSYSDTDFYKENYANIKFEIDHLELHGLDNYFFQLHRQNIRIDENPNNSNIAYLLGITTKAPSGRIKSKGGSFPDIDVDFDASRRDEVFQYLKTKYGEGFAHIGIFGIAKAKGIFKDVCRIYDVPFSEANDWTKMIPDMSESLKDVLKESPGFKLKYDNDSDFKEIVDYAMQMEGCIKSVGVHPCGVALADRPIYEYVPLFESKGVSATQFDGPTLESVGIVKFDILGIKCLSVLGKCFDFVTKRHKAFEYESIYDIPLDNKKTYDLISSGKSLGVFQIEGSALSEFASKCKPKSIEDISAIISLYRPGPMGMKADVEYLNRVSDQFKQWEFEIPEYNHIFEKTCGLLVYQEQLMQLASEMCGFTDIETDELRKAVGKKDREKLLEQKEKFVQGAMNNGFEKERISKLFDSMEEFARYCFNKSHSISYSLLTYYTAYFKANYPCEFFAASISCEDDPDQKPVYIEDARAFNVEVLPPDVNQSSYDFDISITSEILFGFNGIKGLGSKVVDKIIKNRPYYSFGDLLIKAKQVGGINKGHIEALINSGAMDCFGYKRSCMIQYFERYQLDCFGDKKAPEVDPAFIKAHLAKQDEYFNDPHTLEYPLLKILDLEYQLLGIYVSGNPFSVISKLIKDQYHSSEYMLRESEINEYGCVGYILCQLRNIKKHITKTGKAMAFIDAIDYEGNMFNTAMFNGCEKYSAELVPNSYVLLHCISKNGPKGSTIIVNSIRSLEKEVANATFSKTSKNINNIDIHFNGSLGTVQIKSLHSKLSSFISEGKTGYIFRLFIDVEGISYLIKHFNCVELTIDNIRELHKINNIYITRAAKL